MIISIQFRVKVPKFITIKFIILVSRVKVPIISEIEARVKAMQAKKGAEEGSASKVRLDLI